MTNDPSSSDPSSSENALRPVIGSVADVDPSTVWPDDYVDDATRAADERDASATARGDAPPTESEAAAADRALSTMSTEERATVSAAHEDMARRGSEAQGEGRIDV